MTLWFRTAPGVNVFLSYFIDFKFITKQDNKNACVRTTSTFTFYISKKVSTTSMNLPMLSMDVP